MRTLAVACRKCARRGRLSIPRLIAQHGRDDHGDLRMLSRSSASIMITSLNDARTAAENLWARLSQGVPV